MKKNLLLAAVVLPLMSVSAQWTQTGGTVKIQPNTLKYVSQDYAVSGTSTTINEGYVNVRGNFSTDGTTAGEANSGFHNVWTSRNEYGQLIINSASTASGEIENQYNIPSGMAFISMAFPFQNYDAGTAAAQAGIASPTYVTYEAPTGSTNDGFMPGRYEASVWTWHNSTGTPDQFYFATATAATDVLDPKLYHGLNNMDGAVTGTKGFIGVPENTDQTIQVVPYEITTAWDVNAVGELYASYVDDVSLNAPTNWVATDADIPGQADGTPANGYGDNIALFGNPFTSNMRIDGKNGDVNLTNVSHVFQIQENTYIGDGQGGTSNVSDLLVATLTPSGDVATGEEDAVIIRPQGAYFVKGDGNGPANIAIDENTKTFTTRTDTFLLTSRTPNDNGFYQATLELYNSEGNYANNKAFVFASDVIEPNTISRFEAYNNNFGNLGFYSLQENADGTVDQEMLDAKVLINGVNASDYVAKPINLVFKGNGEFTIKTKLTQNLIDSGNRFYFEDRQTGDIFEVTPGFEYTFTSNGTVDDRFFMYWNGTPDVMNVEDVALTSQTRVYKNNNEFSVRFADTWNKADVYVYNALGQLVHTAKQVNTSQDYQLPLKGQASAYIVKTVGDNGEVATQKIVKK